MITLESYNAKETQPDTDRYVIIEYGENHYIGQGYFYDGQWWESVTEDVVEVYSWAEMPNKLI